MGYITNTANTSSGLPSDEVISLRFSADGQLWVSTNIAFARYDGAEWHTYGDQDGFTWGEVRMGKIYIDPQQQVWLTSDENGLARISSDGKVTLYSASEEIEQGLASNTVLDIVQDNNKGYYISNWEQFGTTLSYLSAGGEWTHYPFSVVGNNPFDKLLCLAYDAKRGVLYGGTLFSGVMYFDGEQFAPLSEDYQTAVSELLVSGDKLYAATDLGLMSVDLESKTIISMKTKADGLADDFSTSLAMDQEGRLWVGSDGSGVTCISSQGDTVIYNAAQDLSSNDIYSIAISPVTGRPYMGTRIGGICYQTGEGLWAHVGSTGLASNNVVGVIFDGDFTWYATSAGVSLYTGKLWHNYKLKTDDPSSFAKDYVASMLQDNRPDAKQNIWVSGYGGIACYNKNTEDWNYFPHRVNIVNEEGEEEIHAPRISLMQTQKGDFWVTTFGERLGFASFNPQTGEYQFYNDTNLDLLPEGCNSFFAAVEAPDETLWICSVDGVLLRDKEGNYKMKKFPIEITVTDPNTGQPVKGYDNNVRNVTFAPDGKVWISKLNGIIIYDPVTDEQEIEMGPDQDPVSFVTNIVFDEEGNAFIGTILDGLFVRTKEGVYCHLDESYGLDLKQQIVDLYIREGVLYLCTDLGVYASAEYAKIIEQIRSNEAIAREGETPCFYIYPNPSRDYVVLPPHALRYVVYDMSGLQRMAGEIKSGQKVDLQGLSVGRYLISYLIEGKWVSQQLVVE